MATCYNRYTRQYTYCRNRWSDWGRWVALAVILIIAFLLFFVCACISQRRRRKAGRQPYLGTGFIGNLPFAGPPPAYKQNEQSQQPPQYGNQYQQGPNNQNQYGGANQSYFGGRNDVEMQPPQNVYTNEHNYAPPSGPPPSKQY